jgi:dienelactone hydrolase
LAQTVPASAIAQRTKEFVSYASPGMFRVESALSIWRDDARKRDLPVKLYLPAVLPGKIEAKKFPVILFSHGLGGSREGGERWASHWASHGFIVVAMQHPGSDEGLWKGVAPIDIANKMKAGMTLNNLFLRIDDVQFVIDEIFRRSAAGDATFTNADPKRLGMSGHSFGAQTTVAIAGQKASAPGGQIGLDARVTAAIAFSPNARNRSDLPRQFGEINMPFFSITGTADGSILGDGTEPAHRLLPYQNMPAGKKYLAVFEGGDHMVFGGHGFGPRRPETARDKKIQEAVMAGTLAFWNAHLKQDAAAESWLVQGGYKISLGTDDILEHK